MKINLFKIIGLIYLPVYVAGLLATLIAILFMKPACAALTKTGQLIGNDLSEINFCICLLSRLPVEAAR